MLLSAPYLALLLFAQAGGTPAPIVHPRQDLALPKSVPAMGEIGTLRVGTCNVPPWSVPPSSSNPVWTGVAVQLVKDTATNMGLSIELRSYTLEDLETALEKGEVDIAATALPITAENLSRFAMTPAFDEGGLSIATHLRPPLRFWTVIDRVTTEQTVLWSGTLAITCILFGAILWAAERKRNPPFEGPPARALVEASWWSVVTMFTVGYGDRVPVTFRGKMIAVVWMGLSFILVTVASGLVTSALTVQQLKPMVSGPNELAKARVGCMRDSDGQRFLSSTSIEPVVFPTYEAAVQALSDDRLDAVVGSSVVLSYLIDRYHSHQLIVLPQRLRTDYVGLAMRYGLPEGLERRFELEMLKVAQSDSFRAYRNAIMGEAAGSRD